MELIWYPTTPTTKTTEERAYVVKNEKQLKKMNELFGCDAFLYPALYVNFFGMFMSVDIKRKSEYEKLGYKIIEI